MRTVHLTIQVNEKFADFHFKDDPQALADAVLGTLKANFQNSPMVDEVVPFIALPENHVGFIWNTDEVLGAMYDDQITWAEKYNITQEEAVQILKDFHNDLDPEIMGIWDCLETNIREFVERNRS